MSYQPLLPWFEIARFTRHRLTRAALLAVALVPLFYGAMYVWANWDPYGGLEEVPAAIVNADEIVMLTGPDGTEEPVAVGRLIASNLMNSEAEGNFDWVLTDAGDAAAGLSEGRYAAVLTIPENLSAAATSTTADDPLDAITGTIEFRTNDASNYVTGTVARAIADATVKAMNAQIVEVFLDNVFLGFNDLHLSLAEAADGASELAGGSRQLADGTGQLAEGLGELTDGTGQLAAGTGELAEGTGQLATGAGRLSSGAGELSRGLDDASAQVAELPSATRQLAEGSRQVAEGNRELADQVDAAATAIEELTGAVTERTDDIQAALHELADACETADLDPALCGQLREAASDTEGLVALIEEPARQAGELRTATGQLADGAGQVAEGAAELAGAAGAITSGLREASGAAGQLAAGASDLGAGVNQLDGAAGQLNAGARALDTGAREAADGAGELAGGAGELAEGSGELAEGLAAGAREVPSYSDDEREHLASVASAPFDGETNRDNAVQTYGAALAPYFAAIALWVGAIAIFLLLNAIPQRALASTAASWRVSLAGFLPAALLSVVQAGLLIGLFVSVLRIAPASPWWLLGFAVLAGLAFTAINQALLALLGPAGRFVALIFVSIQVAAAGGTFPVEASPWFFSVIHDLLPLTHAVKGMRTAIAGGDTGLTSSALVLVAWLVGAWCVTTVAASRQRTVTLDALHPPLVTKA